MNEPSPKVCADRNLVDSDLFSRSIARLRNDSESLHQSYSLAQPYPHVVIDDLFAPEILDRIVVEFPQSKHQDSIQSQTILHNMTELSMFTQLFFLWLNSSEFIDELRKIANIKNLSPDPLFFDSGIQEMFQDGYQPMYVDRIKHPLLPMNKRLHLIIYLNRDWNSAWGGDLELWHQKNLTPKVTYPPYFNRTLILATASKNLYGVPNSLSCPPNCSHKVISFSYWSPDNIWRIIRKLEKMYEDMLAKLP